MIIQKTRKLARRASELGDCGTNDHLVSDMMPANERQVWFLSEHENRWEGAGSYEEQ